MARTTIEINDELKALLAASLADAGIVIDTSLWSDTNRLRHLVNCFAYGANKLELLWDNQQAEVSQMLADLKPPSKRWYRETIKNFQFGFPLIPGTIQFDNTGYTEQQILDSKVIKHCAVIKQVNVYGRVKLRFKIAGTNGTDLVQLSQNVVDALTTYLDDDGGAAAGDNWVVEAQPNDDIKQTWKVYYDPLILDANGRRLDGTAGEPVRDAIKAFLKDKMPFSGTYVVVKHIDHVQDVPGVVIPELINCSARYGSLPFTAFTTEYDPDGGWIRFDQDSDLVIQYIPHNAF